MGAGFLRQNAGFGCLMVGLLVVACSQRPYSGGVGEPSAEMPVRVIEVSDDLTPPQVLPEAEAFQGPSENMGQLKMQRVGSREQLTWVRPVAVKGKRQRPRSETVQLTDWPFEIQGAQLSADGKWVLFFTKYFPGGRDDLWSLVVISTEEKFPLRGYAVAKHVIASGVVFDGESKDGQAVFGQDGHLVFYVKKSVDNGDGDADAIFATDLETRKNYLFPTQKIAHRQIAAPASGQITFSAETKRGGERKTYRGLWETRENPQTELTQNRRND